MTDPPPAPPRASFREISVFANVSLDRTEAALSIVSEFAAAEPLPATIVAEISQTGFPVASVQDPITLFPGGTSLVQSVTIPRVQLWQPNGAGRPALYRARLALVTDEGEVLDRSGLEFGVRQVEAGPCEGAPPGSPPYLLAVNGRRTWIRGFHWPMPASGGLERLLRLVQAAHADVLHVQPAPEDPHVESEAFYSLCDRLGIMVWQDFPFPPAAPRPEPLQALFEAVLAQRRGHPSLVLWSGGADLRNAAGEPLGSDHPALAELRSELALDDPQRLWLPTVPLQPGPPGVTLREAPACLDAGDRMLGSGCEAAGAGSLETDFGPLDEAARDRVLAWRRAALLQYAVEADRRRQWRCAGVLPAPFTPVFVDPDGSPTPAYYAVKRTYRPFHVSASFRTFSWEREPQFQAEVWLHNSGEARSLLNGVATVVDLRGRELYQENLAGEAPENGSECIGDLYWRFPREFAEPFLLLLDVIDEEGESLATNAYLHSRCPGSAFAPFFSAATTTLQAERTGEGVGLRNTGETVALGVCVDAGQALVEDSDFPLLPGSARLIRLSDPAAPVLVTAWNASKVSL